jgi:hypothetical protein
MPDFLRSAHRIEHTSNNLFGACTIRRVRSLGFEQLRMCQDDAQLVVQLVKQTSQLWVRGLSVHLDMVR